MNRREMLRVGVGTAVAHGVVTVLGCAAQTGAGHEGHEGHEGHAGGEGGVVDEVGRTLTIKWVPVTSESRIPAVVNGQVDLECGSTTGTAERRRQVAFSPVTYIAGTRLLVRQDSPVRSLRDLAGRAKPSVGKRAAKGKTPAKKQHAAPKKQAATRKKVAIKPGGKPARSRAGVTISSTRSTPPAIPSSRPRIRSI